ncbi:hypothetical protein [Parapedobacter tibetensis]|uniref:hypothetical protein n=1 Tax=Parapedobacter tibetensis TaxID=2972951 RepID=UPI00214D3A59|nr:hypothetical protein [Parapedobacter tibetensis]
MTFEEFFIKKKIDLVQLQRANPDLYAEFYDHYIQMGEKSFDHTKKYWFNRLRKEYLLEEREPINAKSTAIPSPSAKEPPPSTIAAKPAGFKPRFKPMAAKSSETSVPEQTEHKAPEEETAKKATAPQGFKPRFKAGMTPTSKSPAEKLPPEVTENKDTQDEGTETTAPASKPQGFKPRFKPGTSGIKKDRPED